MIKKDRRVCRDNSQDSAKLPVSCELSNFSSWIVCAKARSKNRLDTYLGRKESSYRKTAINMNYNLCA